MNFKNFLTKLTKNLFRPLPLPLSYPGSGCWDISMSYKADKITAEEAIQRLSQKPFKEAEFFLREIAEENPDTALQVIQIFLDYDRNHPQEGILSRTEHAIISLAEKHFENTSLMKALIRTLLDIDGKYVSHTIEKIARACKDNHDVATYAINALSELSEGFTNITIKTLGQKHSHLALVCIATLDQQAKLTNQVKFIFTNPLNIHDIAIAHPEHPEIYKYAIDILLEKNTHDSIMYSVFIAEKIPKSSPYVLNKLLEKDESWDLMYELSPEKEDSWRFLLNVICLVKANLKVLTHLYSELSEHDNYTSLLTYIALSVPNARESILIELRKNLSPYEVQEIQNLLNNSSEFPNDDFNFD